MAMDIQRIRYFLEVARQRNFSRAAQVCHVSQPSLSQQIKKLEEEVDGPLFLRNRTGITLSPLGESFLPYAQAILASVASAEEFLAETRSQARRTIRLGAIPTIAPYLVPSVFTAIRSQEPEINFELLEDRTEAIVEALMEGTIDFALLSPPTEVDAMCEHLTLLRDEFMLTLPATHRLAKSRRISPKELSAENIILLEDSHCLSRQTADYCSTLGVTPNVSIRGSQIETLLRLVEGGFGLTFTPKLAVPAGSGLAFRSITESPCHREIRLMWLRQPILSGTMRRTLRILEEALVKASAR